VVLCAPEEVCFAASSPGIPASEIIWLDNTGAQVGSGAELCVTPPAGSSFYVATADADCVQPDTVFVEVQTEDFMVEASASAGTICLEDSVALTATIAPDSLMPDIEWTLNGNSLGSGSPLVVTPDASGTYDYVATASNECFTDSDTVRVTVLDSILLDAQPDTTILLCAPVEEAFCFTATASGGLASSIVWQDLDGEIVGTGEELCITPAVGDTTLVATLPGFACAGTDTVRLRVDTLPPPSPPIAVDTATICLGDTATLALEEDYLFPYTWLDTAGNVLAINDSLEVAPDETGTFSYIAEGENGCGSARDTSVVVVVDSSVITIDGGGLILCTPDTVSLMADWMMPEATVWTDGSGMPIDTGAAVTVVPETGINVYIAQAPGLNCVQPDTTTIEYLTEPEVEVQASADSICQGDSIMLTATVTPPSSTNFVSWYLDDSGLTFIGDGPSITVSPVAGEYTYVAIAENACGLDTASVDVFVEELSVELVVSSDTICQGDTATLEVLGCPDCTYSWSPAEGLSDPDGAATNASPTETTPYTVTVQGAVCDTVLSATISVEQCLLCEGQVFVADAFTPNGDNNNDSVCLRSEYLDEFEEVEFMIYNRWGEEVFATKDIRNLCWDGKHRGKELPPDVYGYYLRVQCPNQEAVEKQGNITLLR